MNEKQLTRYIQEVMQRQTGKILRSGDLLDEKQSKKLIASIRKSLDEVGSVSEKAITEQLVLSYFTGAEKASKQLDRAGIKVKGMQAFTSRGKVTKAFQAPIHKEALDRIMSDAMLDLTAAVRTAKRSVGTNITATLNDVRNELGGATVSGDARRVVQQRVAESFAKNGFTSFVTSDGKNLPLDFYARTVANTKMRDAAVTGSCNRYREAGVDTVRIIGNDDCCEICAQYQGMVVSLDGLDDRFPSDIPLPPYHPNCHDNVIPYVTDYKSDADLESAFERNDAFVPGEDPRTPEQIKAYEDARKAKRIANDEKKQYARYQAVLGNDAPKTLGAFRRMKHENTFNYQELEMQYRSTMHAAKNLK